ncbi:MAG: PKD domain-containing protein [Saprospiraceae bacterium]|nr:PKD domain-containing protein [Saprospiraceae bacterium]
MKTLQQTLFRIYGILIFAFLLGNIHYSSAQDVYCSTVDFTAVEKENGVVEFSGTSDKPVVEWYWYFGDNNTSREEKPTHQYNYASDYEVCLKVLVNDNCTGAICKKVKVEKGALSGACDLKADFKYEVNGLILNAKGWTLATQPTLRYTWKFGDNTTAEGAEVKHEYTQKGEYNVCLSVTLPATTVSNPPCVETICKTIKVGETNSPCDLKADFKYEVNGLILNAKGWTLATQPALRYTWKFGDNTTAEGAEVKHEDYQKGEYNVCLMVTLPATTVSNPPCVETICKTIKVGETNSPCDLKADFKYEVNGLLLHAKGWTIATQPALLRYTWKFGDNTTAEGAEVKHEYSQKGEYNVCLTVSAPAITASSPPCSETICKTIKIGESGNPCDLTADYKFELTDNILKAIAISNGGNNATYFWKISDGTTAQGPEMKHQFKERGDYEVCLVVTKPTTSASQNCSVVVCKKITVGPTISNADCLLKADFKYLRTNTGIGFHSRSNDANANFTWTVEGRSETYSGQGFSIPLTEPGVYKVCLTVESRTFGCRVQVCKRVVIGRSPGIVSPNPSSDFTRIQSDAIINSFVLLDRSSNKVLQGDVSGNEIVIDLSPFSTGMYYLMLTYEDGTSTMQKIMKQ